MLSNVPYSHYSHRFHDMHSFRSLQNPSCCKVFPFIWQCMFLGFGRIFKASTRHLWVDSVRVCLLIKHPGNLTYTSLTREAEAFMYTSTGQTEERQKEKQKQAETSRDCFLCFDIILPCFVKSLQCACSHSLMLSVNWKAQRRLLGQGYTHSGKKKRRGEGGWVKCSDCSMVAVLATFTSNW